MIYNYIFISILSNFFAVNSILFDARILTTQPTASLFGEYYNSVTDTDSSTYGTDSTDTVRYDANNVTSTFTSDFIQELESRTKNVDNQTISDINNQLEIKNKNEIIESELFIVEHSVINWLENSLKMIVKNAHLYHTLTHTAQTNVICSILVIIGRKIESLICQEKERNEENNYTDIGGSKSGTLSLPGYTNSNSNQLSSLDKIKEKEKQKENENELGRTTIAVAGMGVGRGAGVGAGVGGSVGAGGGGMGRQEKAVSATQSMSVLRCTASQLLSSYRGASLSLLGVDIVKETSKFR
jgi:hypothetical protein